MSVGVGYFSYTPFCLNSKLVRNQFLRVDLTESVTETLSTGMEIITKYIWFIGAMDRRCQGNAEPEKLLGL
jgi:hypothetical protein